MPPPDTSRAAHRAQVMVWRRLGGAGRLKLALSMSDEVRSLSADGIRARHPDYSEADVSWALRRLTLGKALFACAYPDAPALDP